MVLSDAADIAIDIFPRERQLGGINALGATTEMHALELFHRGKGAVDVSAVALERRQSPTVDLEISIQWKSSTAAGESRKSSREMIVETGGRLAGQ